MKEQYCCRFNPVFLLVLVVFAAACAKSEDTPPAAVSGTIVFSANHQVNRQPLKLNELIYTNAAGNEYMITDLMYFISDVTFYRSDGTHTLIGAARDIFYLDEEIPETKIIRFADKIPAGTYDSITFIFGISRAKNTSNLFVNPPESIMGWPEVLGGGYHYMMMNGKWKDPAGNLMPFNFHLGTGQLYSGSTYNVDSIYAFVPNCFTVHLPASSFDLADKQELTFQLTMNIEEWFENPHVYDHNYWGGAIMQNQAAMNMAKENGWNVFTIKKI